MNSTSAVQVIKMLTYILIPVVMAVFGLIGFLVYIVFKEKNKSKDNESESKNSSKKQTNSNNQDKQSIFNFMEFDTVTDNMIVQKDGNRFLMVIECQGINYDLMSGIEKNGVEEGFVQFLNTLRYPIQIYIQTRSINLESSLVGYREKVKDVEIKLRKIGTSKSIKFIFTNLKAGSSALVMESTGEVNFNGEDKYVYISSNVNTEDSTSLMEDKIEVTTKDKNITVKNLTDKNLNTVYVYYKIVTDGNCYLGGITYRAKFENVKGEKSVTADTLHFSNKNSEIIKIEQFSTK